MQINMKLIDTNWIMKILIIWMFNRYTCQTRGHGAVYIKESVLD
jgi:hypothetical protein